MSIDTITVLFSEEENKPYFRYSNIIYNNDGNIVTNTPQLKHLFDTTSDIFQYLVLTEKGCMIIHDDAKWNGYTFKSSNKLVTGNDVFEIPFVYEGKFTWYKLPPEEHNEIMKKYNTPRVSKKKK